MPPDHAKPNRFDPLDVARVMKKDVPLECLRGLASFVVLAHHISLAFFPAHPNLLENTGNPFTARTSVFSFTKNGLAAVVLFFVLSGFVLSRGYFLSGDRSRVIAGALKRWPRLCGPILMAVLFSWLLLRLGLYRHEEVGAMLHSRWLQQFALAYEPGTTFPSTTLWSAISQGAFFTFFRGDAYYNTNLWTMRYELNGSYIVFGLSLLVGPQSASRAVGLSLLFIAGLIAFFSSSLYLAFIVGTALAHLLPATPISLSRTASAALLLLSLYLLGYHDDAGGAFTLIHNLLPSSLDQYHVLILGSSLLIILVEASGSIRRLCSSRLASLIGELSFPLYLVHIPMISAVGCRVFLHGQHQQWPFHRALVAAAVSAVLASILSAIPLMVGNRLWVGSVSEVTRRVLRSRGVAWQRSSRIVADKPPLESRWICCSASSSMAIRAVRSSILSSSWLALLNSRRHSAFHFDSPA